MAEVLVTGATGVVGSAIVPRLLARPSTRVQLLLRARDGTDAAARLEALLAHWSRHEPLAAGDAGRWRDRIGLVRGDITQPDLGLDDTARVQLVARCTHIIHSAASVRMNLPLAEARAHCVTPVRRVIELAGRCRQLAKVDFVSTVGVAGRLPGSLPERWLHEPRTFHNTYEAAKAEAEGEIEAAVRAGLPASVHRPSMVVGDSRNGAVLHFQVFYFLCDFLSGRRTMGLYPRLGEATIDIVPCDFVGAAIVASAFEPSTVGQVLHLCAGPADALRLDELRRRVRAVYRALGCGGRGPCIDLPAGLFLAAVRAASLFMGPSARRAMKVLPIYLDYLAQVKRFEFTRSRLLMQGMGVSVPQPLGLVDGLLAWRLDAGRGGRR